MNIHVITGATGTGRWGVKKFGSYARETFNRLNLMD